MYRDPEFRRFEVLPLTGALGAVIQGVDLAAEPDDATFNDLRRALDKHHALSIRDQRLDARSLQKVARRYGPFSGNPVHQPMDGMDDIVRFVREPDDTGEVIGEHWHMDLAWMVKPPGATMLYGEVIPPVGGDTCFASLVHAYKALSPGMKELLHGLTGIHSGKGVYGINSVQKRLPLRSDGNVDAVEAEHPVICIHPATGQRYVFVNSVITRFKGMTEAESKPIIDYLVSVATRPEFTCRLRWEERTLTMWLNPVVLHTAINDYPGYRRVTYRTTVEGWVPVAAPAEPASAAANRAA